MSRQGPVIAGVLLLVLALIGTALWFVLAPGPVVQTPGTTGPGTDSAPGTIEGARPANPSSHRRRSEAWTQRGHGSLVGTLLEYGSDRPLAGVAVTLDAGGDGPATTLTVLTRDDGGFGFERVAGYASWTLSAAVPPPLRAVEVAGVGVRPDEQTDVGVLYAAPDFVVEGLVVDEHGGPVAGAEVLAVRRGPGAAVFDLVKVVRRMPEPPQPLDRGTSDDEGRYRLRRTPPGRYDLFVSAKGYQTRSVAGVLVAPDRPDTRLRVVLSPGFALDGRVVRTDGGPLEGLRIAAFPQIRGPDALLALAKSFAVTDGSGAFRVEGLGRDAHMVTVTAGALTTTVDGVAVPRDEPLEIEVGGGARLAGRVTTDGGSAVDGAEVFVLSRANEETAFAVAITDSDGRYAVEGLRPGPLGGFTVRAEGFAPYPSDPRDVFERGSGPELALGDNTRDVELDGGGTIRGVVLVQGTTSPLAGVRVTTISGSSILGGGRTATTDSSGRFVLHGVGMGTAMVTLSREGWYQPGDIAQEIQRLAQTVFRSGSSADGDDPGEGPVVVFTETGQVLERTLELAPGVPVAGRVVDPAGAPVPGAQVDVDAPEAASSRFMGGLVGFEGPQPRLTDSEGRFAFPGAAPGTPLVVRAVAAGFIESTSETLTLGPQGKDDIEIRLLAGGTLEGSVRSADGRPVAGARVQWVPQQAGHSAPRIRIDPATTDADGRYVLSGLPPGPATVQATHADHLDSERARADVTDGSATSLEFVLQPGAAIVGRVLDADGEPAAGAQVSVTPTDGEAQKAGARWRAVQARSDGTFRVGGLAVARHDVRVTVASAPVEVVTGVLPGGADLDVRLVRALHITGRLRLAGGGRITGVAAQVSVDGKIWESARLEADGTFAFERLREGTYLLKFGALPSSPRGTPPANVRERVVEGVAAGTEGLEIVLEPGLVISGAALDSERRPLVAGWVTCRPIPADAPDPPPQPKGNVGIRTTQVADGRFEVVGLDPGRYWVEIRSGAGLASAVVDAGATAVTLALPAGGRLTGRVADAAGAPVARAWVSLSGDGVATGAITDEDGRYALEGVPAGRYTVTARAQRTPGRTLSATLENVAVAGAGETSGVDLVVRDP